VGPRPPLVFLGQIFLTASPVNTNRVEEADRLRARVAGVVKSYGLDLFDLQFRRESIGWVLRVMIDRPWDPGAPERESGGEEPVTVDDCGKVSHDLSAILDVEPELVGGDDRTYTLEVSSPGLDRPLRGELDYRRFRGRLAKIVTVHPVGGQSHFEGRIEGVEEGDVLVTQGRRTHRVPLEAIRRARLEVEF
jgi:ribosome maturation factor RimP